MKCSRVTTHPQKGQEQPAEELSWMESTTLDDRYKGYINHLKPADDLSLRKAIHTRPTSTSTLEIVYRIKGVTPLYTL